MFNTLHDDEDHGLEIWREREARRRAEDVCRKVGLKVDRQYLDQLDLAQIRRIISEGLGVLEVLDRPAMKRAHKAYMARSRRA